MPIPSGYTVVPAFCAAGVAVDYATFLFGPPAPGNRYVCTELPRLPSTLAFALVKEVPLVAGTYLVQNVMNRGGNQDDAICTFHWRWDGATDPLSSDFDIVEDRLDGFWTAIATYRTTLQTTGEYRWYGPFDAPAATVGPAVRVTPAPALAGGSAAQGLPQQVACSVTEVTDVRRRWGRFYIPCLTVDTIDVGVNGLYRTTFLDAVANAAATAFIQSNPNWRLVVFGTPLPTSLEVRDIRIDNVPDVIRRRRWEGGGSVTRDISGT